jgi:four helix bundle protein
MVRGKRREIMGNFRDLKVWQRAKEFAVFLYRITGDGEFRKDWGLRDQIRRAVVSISSNIAEGDDLGTDRQAIRFFYTAKGSTAEVLTQAIIAYEIGYLRERHFAHITEECQGISGMLTKLIRARSDKAHGVVHKVQGKRMRP